MSTPDLAAWIGREETQEDTITLARMQQVAATFGWDGTRLSTGQPIPPLAHLFFCNELTPQEALNLDGHHKRGGFMPPVALPRRMWAGSDTRFFAPLRIGEAVKRRSVVVSVTEKQGRSGPLVFVELDRHFTTASGSLCERRTVVYREAPTERAGWTAGQAPEDFSADLERAYTADEIMLFRFSALTWNGHRIHYDRQFCQDHEGYPDIVVHGPMLGFLSAQAAQALRPDHSLTRFVFRSQQPVFVNKAFRILAAHSPEKAASAQVRAVNYAGETALKGEAEWASA